MENQIFELKEINKEIKRENDQLKNLFDFEKHKNLQLEDTLIKVFLTKKSFF